MAAFESYNGLVGVNQGATKGFVKSGGQHLIESGGSIVLESGAQLTVQPGAQIGDGTTLAAGVGAVAAVTGLACAIERYGSFVKLDFTFTDVAVTHTDAAGSGSSGSLKIFDFVNQSIQPIASRSNLTFASDTTMDVAGDLAMIYSFGSAACNAGDGALTGTEADFSAVSGTITFSANAGSSASLVKGAGTAMDGTSTASDLFFNESATAATSDANGVLTVNGTYSLVLVFMGDD